MKLGQRLDGKRAPLFRGRTAAGNGDVGMAAMLHANIGRKDN
ncbi:MAG: hypothetical protein WCF20_10220 [Methylovirgula sp.]